MQFDRVVVIVLDSVGIGELPDAAEFGDSGSHTLGHIAERIKGFALPNMQKLGLGNIAPIPGFSPVEKPGAHYGKMAEVSVGKDTMTGHWELMGLKVGIPFQTFPSGFSEELIGEFERQTGRKVLGNKPASGTEIIQELGEEQMRTGAWIVYTSADSVFQIAAHEEVIPLEELYQACEIARKLTLEAPHAVGRVIARPYIGKPGAFERTANRHDYALKPPAPTALDRLKDAGLDVIAVGKINDIFSGEGVTASYPTKSNADGMARTADLLKGDFRGLLFTNLVDFDSLYGHRRDPEGYARALQDFDAFLPELTAAIKERDLLIITADHGNDPTHSGTDHTREYVPLLVYNPAFQACGSLGVRSTFADLAATLLDNFGLAELELGESFLNQLK
ncbi:phosphopentomutase [Xylanibacillus composti]|uniref:Phosphopentomutase n=1 Tax=Xylanibacillus composti TaxID=1572762 RepID=A0A8J4H4L5_9BACL|nr:phosphopentomutase [Xylanibacillus composti]MDT9726663.1 phosphopentomutase [Xylanibacillus composti]GIQ69406.1 phosphopentomutase [Xylanibacillus composti]